MALGDFLTIAGEPVPVARDGGVRPSLKRAGAIERAWSLMLRNSRNGSKREWTIRTPLMLRSDGLTLKAALEGTPPLVATGRLVDGGPMNVHLDNLLFAVEATKSHPDGSGPTGYVVLQFDMLEE